MSKPEPEALRELAEYARLAYRRRLVGGTGGNASVRLSAGRMAITGSGLRLDATEPGNLVTVDVEEDRWSAPGDHVPSKEYRFHAAIYQRRPDVGAVLHVHPPHATAFAVHRRDIPMLTDAAFKQPPLPRVAFAPSGSEALRDLVARAVEENPGCKALLLEEHGLIALGADISAAYDYADLVEELATIAHLAESL